MEKVNKNISFYSIIIEACEEGGYFAYCPVLQGCHAEGETYGEAIDNEGIGDSHHCFRNYVV